MNYFFSCLPLLVVSVTLICMNMPTDQQGNTNLVTPAESGNQQTINNITTDELVSLIDTDNTQIKMLETQLHLDWLDITEQENQLAMMKKIVALTRAEQVLVQCIKKSKNE